MSWIVIAALGSFAVNIVQGFLYKLKNDRYKDLSKAHNKMTGENRKLQSAIIEIDKIEKERQKDVEEIKNVPDNRVTDILNSVMRNASKG